MLTLILVTVLLAVLYGLAWHNEPAKSRPSERHAHPPGARAKT